MRLCWVDTVPKAVKGMIDKAVAILQEQAAPTLLTAADDAFAVGLASAEQSDWVVAPSPHAHAMGWSGLQARTPPEEPWSPSPVRQPSCSKQLFGPGPGASPISPQHVTVQSPASPIAVSAAMSRQTPVKRGAPLGTSGLLPRSPPSKAMRRHLSCTTPSTTCCSSPRKALSGIS